MMQWRDENREAMTIPNSVMIRFFKEAIVYAMKHIPHW